MGTSRIGLLGGAFNPIHLGHLSAAEETREIYRLEKVIFIPCGQTPWDKSEPLAPVESRFRLVALAISDNPHFAISRVEIDRPGRSYSIDTLRLLREQEPHADFFLIVGLDALLQFDQWKEPEAILELAQLVAVSRPGYRLEPAFTKKLDSRIMFIEIPGVAISSSEIRERLRAGRSIRYLVPRLVEEAILQENWYREEVSSSTPSNWSMS